MKVVGQNSIATRRIQDLQSAAEGRRLGFWVCDPATDRLWATAGFWKVTEVNSSQVGASFSAFSKQLHHDDCRSLTACIERAGLDRATFDLELRVTRPDAPARRIHLTGQVVEWKKGKLRIAGNVWATVSRNEQEQEAADLRNSLKSFLENSPEIVVRLDQAGSVLLASSAFQNRLRAESGFNSVLLQHLRELSKKVFATRAPQEHEYCVEVLGRLQWLDTTAVPEIGPDGKIASVLTFTRDVTDRKLNENLLESSNRSLLVAMESMELAQEAAGMGYWHRDMATDTVRWSDRVYTLFGLTPGAVTPSYEEWIGILHPEDRQFCEAAVRQAYGPTGKYRCQYRIILPNGAIRWLEENGKLIHDFAGNPTRMIGTVRDITEQKEQESALVYFEKLSSAMRLSSTLAHEINNPLTAVTYLLHLALQDPRLSTTTRDHLSAAQEELARAVHVASQTLSLYRPSSEKLPVDVGAIIGELLRIYRHRLRSKKVETVTRIEQGTVASVSADELRQILSNLIVNAMDAAAAGRRRVVIRVRNLAPLNAPNKVQITVADEGPGIERALRKKVFEPFFTTKGNYGIGLGLWLTRELVKRNSGTIAVRSCTALSNSWTAFVISFPAAPAEPMRLSLPETATQAA